MIYDHREPGHAKRAYAEMMIEMDKRIGDVLDALQQSGADRNTLLLFFSDNGATGPGSCGQLYGMKGTLWEGGHRVSGIACWPGAIKAGTVQSQLACTIDVMPTILDFAGVSLLAEHNLDGISLTEILTESHIGAERKLFWKYGDAISMRDGDWKLVVNGGRPPKPRDALPHINWHHPADGREELALFDLGNDLGEMSNLAARQAERAEAMNAEIESWLRKVLVDATVQPEKAKIEQSNRRLTQVLSGVLSRTFALHALAN